MNSVKKKKRISNIKMITSKFGYGCQKEVLVFVSNKNIYAQVIDLSNGKTLFSISTVSKNKNNKQNHRNIVSAVEIGKLLANKCKEQNIDKISFNRAEKIFHGVVKALADSFYSNLLK